MPFTLDPWPIAGRSSLMSWMRSTLRTRACVSSARAGSPRACVLASLVILAGCGGGGGGDSSPPAPPPVAINQPPTPARLVEVSSAAVGALSVSWLPATDDRTTPAAMRYQVHVATDAGFVPSTATQKAVVTGALSATLADGLQRGTRYTVKVVAVDEQEALAAPSVGLDAVVADTAAAPVAGVVTQQLSPAQLSTVTAAGVVLAPGTPAPAVGTIIASSEANGGLGFLRRVTAVTTSGGVSTLTTRPAAATEVLSSARLSASYNLDAVPREVAQAAGQLGSMRVLTAADGSRQQRFEWPDTGLQFGTAEDADVGRSRILSAAQPQAIGGVVSDGFRSSVGATVAGEWGQIGGQTRVEVNEGKSGVDLWTVDITTTRTPWFSSTPVGICRVEAGRVRGGGSGGRPDLVSVTAEAYTAVETASGNRVTRATQAFRFAASAGAAAASEPYRVKLTAYLDRAQDNCADTNWVEEVHIEVLVMATQDTFPTQESTDTVFEGSAGFRINNRVVTSFSPRLVMNHEISGARLVSARVAVSASPVVEQTLTLAATAQGSVDSTQVVLRPRPFRKVYITPAGIPVIISGSFEVRLRIEGEVSGQLDATEVLRIGYDEVSFGVEYRDGQFVPVTSATPVYSLRVAGNGQAQASLRLTLLPMLEIKAWEAVTTKAVLAPSLRATAGVEGLVRLDAMVDFENESQLLTASDADYRLTQASLDAALDAYLYADLSLWDSRLLVYPDTNPDPAVYTSFKRVALMPSQTLLALPTLAAFLPDGAGAVHPSNTQLLKVRATAANHPNPLFTLFPSVLPESFLPWSRWTPTKLVAPLGAPAGSYGVVADSTGESGVSWVRITRPGRYVVRPGGYSTLGSWARQYTEVVVEVFDENANGIPDWWEARYALQGDSGAAIAQADPDGDGLSNLEEWNAGSDPRVAPPAWARLNIDPAAATVLQAVRVWVSEALQRVASVVFSFGAGVAEQTAAVVNGASAVVSQVFESAGARTVVATLRDSAGALLGRVSGSVVVQSNAPVVTAVTPLVAVAGQSIDFVVTGRQLPFGLRLQLPGCSPVLEGVGGTATERRFLCTLAADTPAGPLDGTVALSDSPFGAPPLFSFTVQVQRGAVSGVQPAGTVRGIASSFDISGSNLPASGISVVPLGDARSTCQAPNNLRATGFGVACELFKVGAQQLQVRAGTQVLGVVTVQVRSNVTGVSWSSPSTSNSGTVRFGETVTFTVRGTNLLVDPVMGFAVERCGVSNTEVGTPTDTERRFRCLFNNEAGAVAGQMPGVVKDAPGGQVLFDGWNVPVEQPPAPAGLAVDGSYVWAGPYTLPLPAGTAPFSGNDRNFSDDRRWVVCGSGRGSTAKTLVTLDHTQVPASAGQVYLNLYLEATDSTGDSMLEAYQAWSAPAWAPSTVTWNTAPGFDPANRYGQLALPFPFTPGWVRIPITWMVQEWQNGSRQNNGLVLDARGNPNAACRMFAGSRSATNRPYVSWETAPGSALFADDFTGPALDATRWSVESVGGAPATTSQSGGSLTVVVPGGSCGSCGVSDGSTFRPRMAPLTGDFEMILSAQVLERLSRDGRPPLSTLQLLLGAPGAGAEVGLVMIGDVTSNQGQPGRVVYAYHRNGSNAVFPLSRGLSMDTHEALELRIRRTGDAIRLGLRVAGESAWTEVHVPAGFPASALTEPRIVVASGDGGGTRVNSIVRLRMDDFSIRR